MNISHAPMNYECPICEWFRGKQTEYNQDQDLVLQTGWAIAFISPKWWPNNPGHVMVVPKRHYENIYTIPPDIHSHLYEAAQEVAIAIKEVYKCDGVSIRQHNEPAGNQDLWHFHLHVFPRWYNDNLYTEQNHTSYISAAKRLPYAEKLIKYFSKHRLQGK